MKNLFTATFLMLFAFISAQKFSMRSYDAQPVAPIFEEPLRHPNICLAADGFYYLTGTSGENDWAYSNEEITVWKSSDLKNWQSIGTVWTQKDHAVFKSKTVALPETYHSKKARGFRAPEIAWINNNFYLVYSMATGGIYVAKSTSGKAEGPYKSLGELLTFGTDPSLFQDDDKKIYLAFNGGFVAPVKDDLTQLMEQPRYIFPQIEPSKGWGLKSPMERIGTYGARIFKWNGKYCISAGDAHWRMSTHTHDLFIAQSEGGIYGPYNRRYMSVPNAGNGCVFKDKENQWWATYSGDPADPYTLFSGKTGLVLLAPYTHKNQTLLRPATSVIWEKGAIGSAHPVKDLKDQFSRDPSICIGHDGAYYMVCTIEKESLAPDGGIKMWRSENLHNWIYVGLVWNWKDDAPKWLNKRKLNDRFWAPEISYLNGKYYIAVSLSEIPRATWIMESPINKPQGPYKDPVGNQLVKGIDGFFFKDVDESIYFLWGNGHIGKMKKDMSGFEGETWHIVDGEGELLGYEGVGIIRHKGKYIIHAADHSGDHNGTYDFSYVIADNLKGPYSKRKLTMPHVGHTTIFKAKDGKWYCTLFGSDGSNAFSQRMGILELEITDDFEFVVKDTKIGY